MNSGNPFFYDESDITQRVIWKNMNAKSSCSIAKVMAINAAPVSVNIQPLIKYFDLISKWEDYPVLNYVPVAQMQTSSYSINTPLNVGDVGIVLWFDREVYTCLQSGATTTTTPDSGNLFDTNACVFLPILPSFALANTLMPTGVDIISANISLLTQILANLTNITSLLTSLATFANVLTGLGISISPGDTLIGSNYAQPVGGAATILSTAITTIATNVATITSQLTTFKGSQP